jgi:hypothetical protein
LFYREKLVRQGPPEFIEGLTANGNGFAGTDYKREFCTFLSKMLNRILVCGKGKQPIILLSYVG